MFPRTYDPTQDVFHPEDLSPQDAPVVCPQVKYYTDVTTGQKAKFIWRCNNKHTCENCRKLEAEKYAVRMWRAYQTATETGDQLVYAYAPTDSELSDEIRKRINKEGRWSIPMASGETCHVMRLKEAEKLTTLAEVRPLQPEDIKQMDFNALVQSPPREKHGKGGKQMSGGLGKASAPVAPVEEMVNVELAAFTTDLPVHEQEKIDARVDEMTQDMRPTELATAEIMADQITSLRMRLYEEAGARITSVGQHIQRVPKNVSINWGNRNISRGRNQEERYVQLVRG